VLDVQHDLQKVLHSSLLNGGQRKVVERNERSKGIFYRSSVGVAQVGSGELRSRALLDGGDVSARRGK
jgi:hypothetical protein